MLTVPAHIFCAPTRAKLIAAARFIPGVCGVLVSSWSPGITLTPCSFQSVWLCGVSVMAVILWVATDITEARRWFNKRRLLDITTELRYILITIYRRTVRPRSLSDVS